MVRSRVENDKDKESNEDESFESQPSEDTCEHTELIEQEISQTPNSNGRSTFKCIIIISFAVLLPSIVIGVFFYNLNNLQRLDPIKYNDVIPDAPSYKWSYLENFFENRTIDLFRTLALSGEPLTTIVEDKSIESAGEAVTVGHVDCKHPFMTLNLNRTMCHFSNRLDVGMHFVKTGGFNGHIEYYERMVARIIPFRRRLIQKTQNSYNSFLNLKTLPEFNSVEFLDKIRTICSDCSLFKKDPVHHKKESILNEMFQLDLLLMLPGQELPMHLNVPYFWGADRNTLPQWLLVIMKKSKLFDHLFIPQVQGFNWLDLEEYVSSGAKDEYVDLNGEGGDFYFYPYLPVQKKNPLSQEDEISKENVNKYIILKQVPNSAIVLDGAQIIHGVDRYRYYDIPPLFSHNHHYKIRFNKDRNLWVLYDYKENELRSYYKNDVKLMVVWNMHCFANEEERTKFHSQTEQLSLESIMEVFKKDLRQKGRLPADDIEPLDLWTIVIKEYLTYPANTHQQSSTFFGINYCLLPNIVPEWFTRNVLQPFLEGRC